MPEVEMLSLMHEIWGDPANIRIVLDVKCKKLRLDSNERGRRGVGRVVVSDVGSVNYEL